jgi:hypothetical protein
MTSRFYPTNRRPENVRPFCDGLQEQPAQACWYDFLFDEATWPEFLGQVYDICDQRMFYIENTPCWPSHPDVVMEFLSIIRAYKAFQDGSGFETDPCFGLDLCEEIDKAFERINKKLDRCSSECHYDRQRRVDKEWASRTTPVEDLSRFVLPGVFDCSWVDSPPLPPLPEDLFEDDILD